jgi:ATP-dependent DNA helicase RecG
LDIKYIKGIGDKRAEAFKKIGVTNIEDFLSFIPRSYIRRVNVTGIDKNTDELIAVYGEVVQVKLPSKQNHPVKVFLRDSTGIIEIPIFGATEFRSKQFRLYGKYIFCGKLELNFYSRNICLNYRDHLPINENDANDFELLKYPYLPVYELSGVLKKTWIKTLSLAKIVFNAFKTIAKNNTDFIEESLPQNILDNYNLSSKKDAVLRINFPLKYDDIENSRKRLAFEELFYLQLIMALRKEHIQNEKKGISFNNDIMDFNKSFKEALEFELTGSQKKVMNEIYEDMKSDKCMNRLLQGDVGSGKTIVAIYAMLVAIENGYQAAFMCPTEILAEQHYKTISNFVSKLGVKAVLLIGGQKKKLREEILDDIKSGNSNIIIGTHALIQEKVEFNKLGFVIIDEQHKFGVMQRAKLKEKGLNPDVLIMTATPIPRTLSLAYYGDLDVSVIDEMPKNRKEVKTALRKDADKEKIFDFVKKEIKNGRQVFIVYPIIDESEKLELKAAEEEFVYLKENVFTEHVTGMVHGRMQSHEKDEVMEDFKNSKIKILVSTTVIEVGIDIPNATIMIIEEAQRFGLSQLHQLRGRVGRGAEQSYCILIAKGNEEDTMKRLNILCETNNGFEIAEKDMDIRGPGEFFGIRQSGVLNFSCTDLSKDKDLLQQARDIAFEIIQNDTYLRKPEHKIIRDNFMANYKDSLYLMKIA